jgi:hypothetical protein
MLRIQAIAKSAEELRKITNPNDASQPESIPWVYYDTQNFLTASTAAISFFAVTNADRTISNLEQAGTIPDPYYFEIEAINLDYMVRPSAGGNTAVGTLDDLAQFLYTSRSTLEFSIAGKLYLRIPCSYLHASGGPNGTALAATLTAPNLISFAVNGIVDGGFYVGKKIVLPPKQSFQAQIIVGAASTLVTSPAPLRLSMAGVLHRRVL